MALFTRPGSGVRAGSVVVVDAKGGGGTGGGVADCVGDALADGADWVIGLGGSFLHGCQIRPMAHASRATDKMATGISHRRLALVIGATRGVGGRSALDHAA